MTSDQPGQTHLPTGHHTHWRGGLRAVTTDHPGAPPVKEQPSARPSRDLVDQIRLAVAVRLDELGQDDVPAQETRNPAAEHARMLALAHEEITDWVVRNAQAGRPPVPLSFERELAQAVVASMAGLGALLPLLEREDVENIHIHGYDRVWLELADGSLERWQYVVADSDATLITMVADLAARMGQTAREFSPANPMVSFRIPAGGLLGARLSAVMSLTDRPRIAIRRHRLHDVGLDDLVRAGTLDSILVAFLRAAVRAGKNIVVTGGPYTGKTTALRALAREIPANEHLITVEDDAELGLDLLGTHTLVTPLEARQGNAEGAGEVTLDDLLKQTLRHSPSRVLVGEVRAGEVTSLLRALGNGAAGGMCTLHAASAAAVTDRIAALGQLAAPPLPVEAAYRWTASAIDLVVHLAKVDHHDPHSGRFSRQRYVTEIAELGPVGDTGRPDLTHLFSPRPVDGRAIPAFPPSPGLMADLIRHGFDPALLHQTEGDWQPAFLRRDLS
ncbi:MULTISPECIES: CpaF family protein [unclassified Crossiella]|uniref:CpaF family protein n=1 Tax=unclassified Crossiella TaxID=2620835 RepID=UPI001FFEDD31|nr:MULTISPECIES: ATPase, T2SS/T4P/T4SS family [unclassified Crossiella]MCK2241867.1 Flp pilus assembly complex ATPase component TadA [Crossiella sp. S99.2]MCK2255770.1 Flp pilus assembly complex ATPase component TadA [Crossiella sp. S99.1]